MIVLSDERGIVPIESWDDVLGRAAYSSNVDPKAQALKTIIGRYQFKDEVPCGLKTCRQPHNSGYLVLTKSGIETNIGKDCGRKYFSVEFRQMSRRFDRDLLAKERRDRIGAFQARLPALREALAALRADGDGYGADSLVRLQAQLVGASSETPRPILDAIRVIVRSSDDLLRTQRKASDAEADQMDVAEGKRAPRPRFIDNTPVSIRGVAFLRRDLRQLIAQDLEPGFDEIESFDVDTASPIAIRDKAKWAGEVDGKLEIVRELVALGRSLFTIPNLTPLARVTGDAAEKNIFKTFLKALPQAVSSEAAV